MRDKPLTTIEDPEIFGALVEQGKIQTRQEVLRGAKKIDVCRKYDIPNYRFSRVLNMKYGRPSYREQVYELYKKYNKLD